MKGNGFYKNSSFLGSFVYAFRGIVWVAATQRNMKIHLAAAVAVLAAAVWFGLSPAETAVIVLAVALVMVAETINSAIEKVVDMVTGGYHPLARMAKDAAAGAVLLAAFFSAVVGALVLLPHIIK
ncbi:MAG: diacylglycerol kinase family protein [Actinobacteria bacterium]|nr:diacylglycerol kinase family protein [Actinomycetota bacterium]